MAVPLVFSLYADIAPWTDGENVFIHDLKTGIVPAHMEQLLIYDALFCLEYRIKPSSIQIENRIYQSDDILIANPAAEDVEPIMDKIREFDPIIAKMKMGVC